MKSRRKYLWAWPAHLDAGRLVLLDYKNTYSGYVRVHVTLATAKRRKGR